MCCFEHAAQELTESSIRESDGMVDQLERTEVSELDEPICIRRLRRLARRLDKRRSEYRSSEVRLNTLDLEQYARACLHGLVDPTDGIPTYGVAIDAVSRALTWQLETKAAALRAYIFKLVE